MRRFVVTCGALFALGLCASTSSAQYSSQYSGQHSGYSSGGCRTCNHCGTGYVRNSFHKIGNEWMFNNMWPDQFQPFERQAVRAPFAIMIDKGWQLQNTLGDYHFDVETQQLTRAGELHLRWIVTQTPESRRTVFVLRGHNDAATSVRIDTVQQSIAQIQPRGPLPAVVQTTVAPPSSPAEYVHDVNEKAVRSRPNPTLPAGGGGDGAGL